MAYDVHLEIFEGPLDLLLHLIKKSDLEIAEIPIAQITKEYLEYVDVMKELNLEVAGEFLVMASTLMQIKARMLLPAPETEEDEGPNPLEELKAKLLEYQKYKEVGQLLGQKESEFSNIYYRPAPAFEKDDFTLEATLFDLIDSFRNVLKELPKNVKEIVYKEIPIEQKIREILDMMEGQPHISFTEIFRRQPTRHDVVVSFMAILELIRLKQIAAFQSEAFSEIRMYRVDEKKKEEAAKPVEEPLPADAIDRPGELGADIPPEASAAAVAYLNKEEDDPLAESIAEEQADAGTAAAGNDTAASAQEKPADAEQAPAADAGGTDDTTIKPEGANSHGNS